MPKSLTIIDKNAKSVKTEYIPYASAPTRFCTVRSMPKMKKGFINRLTPIKKNKLREKVLFINGNVEDFFKTSDALNDYFFKRNKKSLKTGCTELKADSSKTEFPYQTRSKIKVACLNGSKCVCSRNSNK